MKLQAFIYLLLRDYLPSGQVERILMEVGKCADKLPIYSNTFLAEYSRQIAEELSFNDKRKEKEL